MSFMERIRKCFYITFSMGVEINGGRLYSAEGGKSWTIDFIPLHWGWKAHKEFLYFTAYHIGPFYLTTNKK